jgi:hypothetical protein
MLWGKNTGNSGQKLLLSNQKGEKYADKKL